MLLETGGALNKTSSMAPDPNAPALTPTVADVVFLVEANANLGPYIDTLKNVYINPTLLHFNGGNSIDGDYGTDRIATMYRCVCSVHDYDGGEGRWVQLVGSGSFRSFWVFF